MSVALGSAKPVVGFRAEAASWQPGSGKFALLTGVLLLLFAAYAVTYLATTLASEKGFGDAFGLWSWARFLATHPTAEIYDPVVLHAAQVALGVPSQDTFPFAYPPPFLLVLRPLGLFSCAVAIGVLIGATLPLYLWATVGKNWRSPLTLAALVAPTTTMAIVAGQSAFLSAALLIGGFRLTECRPVLAGVLFGLLSYKPQIGLLVPVALVAAGLWRTVAAAVATLIVLVVATGALFGPSIWTDWLAAMPAYSRQFAAESSEILHLMPTVLASLVQLGVPASVAGPVQWLATASMAVMVWVVFRAGPRELAVAALLAAGFLATPYAFVYDMPMVMTAVLWVVIERQRSGEAFGSIEVLVLMLATVAPITLPAGPHFPLVATLLILLLAVILRRIWVLRSRARPVSAPALCEAG